MIVDSEAGGKPSRAALNVSDERRREIMQWRREQRTALIAARLAMPNAVRQVASDLIRQRLGDYLQHHRPAVLAGYWPIQREFNLLSFLAEQLASGTRIVLPVIAAKNQPLEFRLWTPGARMETGVYDIAYPADGAVVLPDTLLLPMVGFDAAGHRLGFGGGYYDRTGAALTPRPRLIGIAYESAQLPSIRPLAHDIPMDCIITEQATRTFD
jgi:5-formyltetrahydrofolate cyclo-ligase